VKLKACPYHVRELPSLTLRAELKLSFSYIKILFFRYNNSFIIIVPAL
jgi:hypothetical protein